MVNQSKNLKRKGAGRPKGSPNKTTAAVKEAILQAFDKAGGVNYLVDLAKNEPKAFCNLLAKVLPLDVKASGEIRIAALSWIKDERDRG